MALAFCQSLSFYCGTFMTRNFPTVKLIDIIAKHICRVCGCLFIVHCIFLATNAAHAVSLTDYKLMVGDVVEFDYLDDLELPRQLPIGAGGKIQVPILGSVVVSGMTVDEAIDTIRKQLIDRKLLNNPMFTLSVFTYRPIYVIGDVKVPGLVPFHANMTVEQAISLAGGPPTTGETAANRIEARAQLEGDLYGTDSDITRQAVWIARLTAELAGRDKIDPTDLPSKAQPYLEKAALEELISVENRILEADKTAISSQKSILAANIAATKNQLQLFDKLAENQKITIASTADMLSRSDKLLKSGLKTAGDLADIQRQYTSDQGRLLQILADKGNAVLRNSTLEQQLATLEDGWKKDTLVALQDRSAALLLLIARRRATEEQLYLVTNWAAIEQKNDQQAVMNYKIRSRPGEAAGDISAKANTELLPGDVLVVSIERPQLENPKATTTP
jgi:polysaccharide biosynthesis/export protein ExoF